MSNIDLLVAGKFVFTGDSILRNGAVAVKDDRIVDVGAKQEIRDAYDSERVISAAEQVVLPGLVNSHTHETLPRGFHEDLPLMEWLQTSTLPAERALTPEQMRAAARLNQLEMIRSGTTTFVEIFRHQGVAADVATKSGLRAAFSAQAIDEPYEIETVSSNRDVFEEYHGACDGRIQVWFGIHAPYTCTEETILEAKEAARAVDTRLHTHLAETEDEIEQIRERSGLTPVEYLDDLGVLTERLHTAHCVHLSENDMDLLAESGASVAYNPISNLKLADGIAPVPELRKRGIPVGLATDSNLSNNNIDMFEEMRMGSYVQKHRLDDPSVMSRETMLRLATEDAADALGLEHVGRLEPGYKADIITVDLDAAHLRPVFAQDELNNLLANLVYSGKGSDVTNTIVDGEVLMRDQKVLSLDEDKTFEDAQSAAEELDAMVKKTT